MTADLLNRRKALERLLELLAAAASAEGMGIAGPGVGPRPAATVPVLTGGEHGDASTVFFSPEQKAIVGALADIIIPDDGVAPGARAAKVEEYLDFVLARATREEQRGWTEGLTALDQTCRDHHGKAAAALSADQRRAVLASLAEGEVSPQTPAQECFARLKRSVADAYYTSEIGLVEDLKYKGNTVVRSPATCEDHFGEPRSAKSPSVLSHN